MIIRPIAPNSKEETSLVAKRMKKTLIDVMGEKDGKNYYSDEWLISRVEQHINLKENACIFLSEENSGEISGQAIIRIEKDNGTNYGFFSTIYVAEEFRGKGIAKELIMAVLKWCKDKDLKRVTYNTAENHTSIINLFGKFKFKESLRADGMVKLVVSF
ncbi:MAG: GNAT family N-acetyltransferase [Halobacteriovoraceae bacterium]|nr:GNAT family N-acetyltransferase [Halobacteriovoraceae bacterium]